MIRTYEPSEVQYGFEKSKTSKTRRCCARGFCWDCGEMKYTGFARLFAGPNNAKVYKADSFLCSSDSCVASTIERATLSAKLKMFTFLVTWRPEKKDLVFGVDHHKLWALLDKTRQATFSIPWRCMRMKDKTVPAWTPVRWNGMDHEKADVECMSLDGTNCLWAFDDKRDECFKFVNSRLENQTDVKPLVCGEMHKAKYGSTGYEQSSHWCSVGKNFLKPVDPPLERPEVAAAKVQNKAGHEEITAPDASTRDAIWARCATLVHCNSCVRAILMDHKGKRYTKWQENGSPSRSPKPRHSPPIASSVDNFVGYASMFSKFPATREKPSALYTTPTTSSSGRRFLRGA
ncbi:hypothetical protein HDU67_001361 [Dinochytrium kinnereticum]|nr:hypothetical protein HDU67_001361 [Dinochytrium kinnereticum]